MDHPRMVMAMAMVVMMRMMMKIGAMIYHQLWLNLTLK
jgi:hypothetical protein